MASPTQVKGQWAEAESVKYLQAKGWRIVERNFFTQFGELDIVAYDKDTLVFVEVKSFDYPYQGTDPAENVHYGKQRKLIKTAKVYLTRLKRHPFCRFDVITLIRYPELRLEHHVGAFHA